MPKSLRTRSPHATRTLQTIDLPDLSGGLDLRRSPTLIGPSRARALRNYSLGTPGEIAVRLGYVAYSTTNLGSQRGQGGQRVYLASTQFTLLAWNGALYQPTDSNTLSTGAVGSTISPTHQAYFPYDRDLVAVFDSTNRPRMSTGDATWALMGVDAAVTQQCTVSSAGGGSLSASEFAFTFGYKHRGTAHYSNISTLVSTITLGSTGQVSVQIPNSTDPKVDAVVVYARNKTAGEAVLRKASSAVASTGASSTVVITSSNWATNDEAPTNHHAPTPMAFGVVWKNRWWAKSGSVGNRLHFTELFQAQSWPTLFYIDIPFERGDEITALVPQGDTLLVFGQSKLYLIIGQTSLDFEVRPSAGAQAGALGPRAVAAIEHGIVHAAADGVFIYDGASDRYLSFDIEPGWRDLIQQGAPADLQTVAVVHDFRFKELRIAVPRLYPRGTPGEWVLDLNRTRESETPAWTDTDRTIGGYIPWDGDEPVAGHRGRLLTWDSTQGRVFEESTGTSANSSNLTAEYEGPHLAMGLHLARILAVRGEYEPHLGGFTEEVIVDGLSQGQEAINIQSGVSVYGTAVYGTGRYGGSGRKMYVIPQPITAEGRTVWIKNSYVGREQFRQFTKAIDMVPETSQREFSD